MRFTSRCRQHKPVSKLYHSFHMKNRMRWKTPLALVLAAQLVGCVWIGDMLSKYVATVPQSAGVQEVDKTLDVFGEHEIMFVFHGYDCSVPLPGHADIEVLTLGGKKLAGASFDLAELTFAYSLSPSDCYQPGYFREGGKVGARPLIFSGYSTVRVRARIHGFQGSGVGNMEIWSAHEMFMPPKTPQQTLEQKAAGKD